MHHRCSILNLIWIIKFLGNFTIFFLESCKNFLTLSFDSEKSSEFCQRIFCMHLFQCCIKETFSNIIKNTKIFAFHSS